MSPRLSERTRFLRQSEIRNMTLECTRVSGINLSQGVCDTPVPEVVRRAAQQAIDEGHNIYTRYDGVPELRRVISEKLARDNALHYSADGEIVVTSGSSAAFYGAGLGLFDPGDEAILFEPYYGYHLDTFRSLGMTTRFVKLDPPEWSFGKEALGRAITPKTRAIVVNTPANPCGKVWTLDELLLVASFAEKHDLYVITDEIYEHFLYDGRRHVSPGSIAGLADRTVTVSGFSKTLSITGWRIGFSAARAKVAERLGHINDLVYICAPAPLQMGVAKALGMLDASFYTALGAEYAKKRDKICEALNRGGLLPYVPQGAYYVLADISRFPGNTSKERVMQLLEATGVAAVPGDAFYENGGGENLARFCFAKTDRDLDEACRRLERLSR